jgi:hypothetical protein
MAVKRDPWHTKTVRWPTRGSQAETGSGPRHRRVGVEDGWRSSAGTTAPSEVPPEEEAPCLGPSSGRGACRADLDLNPTRPEGAIGLRCGVGAGVATARVGVSGKHRGRG